jgi:hypothetical protein
MICTTVGPWGICTTDLGGVVVVASTVRGPIGLVARSVLVVSTVVATVSACGSTAAPSPGPTGSSGSAAPTSTPSRTPATPADRARQAATATYLGMWQQMVAAGTTSDWQSPTFAQYATGDALNTIARSLYGDHLNGVVTKGTPTNNPSVSSVDPQDDPTTVMISDCGNDSGWLKYKDNGQLLNNTPGGRRKITAEVKRQTDGSWRVSRFAVEGVGSC